MFPRCLVPHSVQAVVSYRGGCLSGFILPPLAAVVMGFIFAFFTLGFGGIELSPYLESSESAPLPSESMILSSVFTLEVQYWADRIKIWSEENGLDPNFVATVIQIESCGDPNACSRAGAIGLFQVMPYHFDSLDDPYNPEINALRGLAYLKHSFNISGGDIRLTLAGYNGGVSVIGRPEYTWSAETLRYVYWGSGIYQDVISGQNESLRLQEWLLAGGVSLCRQAQQNLDISS